MTIRLTYNRDRLQKYRNIAALVPLEWYIIFLSALFAVLGTAFFYAKDDIVAYGDAESHLNIAKRVVDSITPGFAQLGGIWLPLPHLVMMPFTVFDSMWRTGFAGSIVSGTCYIVICVFLYKLTRFLTHNTLAAFVTFLVFALNPNILYMQSTPMTELPLLAFFTLSSYYFILFIKGSYHRRYLSQAQANKQLLNLLLAAFFGFLSTLTRYDGWFLVGFEALILIAIYLPCRGLWSAMKGHVILFSTLAFFGILLWLLWGFLILGDPFYFTDSEFSAKTQQLAWLKRGELPAFHHPLTALSYYAVTAMSNIGILIAFAALLGIWLFIKYYGRKKFLVLLVLHVPFIFNVVSLFLGQSVIFIPHLTPVSFEWRLFNVRYGIMMVPVAAVFIGYLFYVTNTAKRFLLIGLFFLQCLLFVSNYSQVITLADGTTGLSKAKKVDAQAWIYRNYDSGLVLMDDYARSLRIIKSPIPMKNIIYIGNRPYWQESLVEPEKYATWIIMQKDDAVWRSIYENPQIQARLYKYFEKAYTSPDIIIFKRMQTTAAVAQH